MGPVQLTAASIIIIAQAVHRSGQQSDSQLPVESAKIYYSGPITTIALVIILLDTLKDLHIEGVII